MYKSIWWFPSRDSSSVQFSSSVVSNSLWPHGLQHARPPCPSPTPRAYSNACPLSWWCHPTISSSVIPFSSHLQSFPASGSFQMSQFFTSGGQRIGVSASASVQFSSVAQSCLTLCDPMDHSILGLPVHHQLPEFTHTHAHWVGDAIQPSHPLLSPSPPALNLSQHQDLFKWVSIRWPKYWSFSFSISPSNEYWGLISFMMDWFDFLAVQGTLQESLPTPQFKNMVQKRSESSFLRSQLIWWVSTSG